MNPKVFFIADTHFGHSNIIKYENRPFQDTEEMDRMLINNWNAVVKQANEVFILGDFSLYGREGTTKICQALNGRKTLIMGNHEDKPPNFYRECGFENVSKYPIIINGFWMLSHEPLYVNANMPYANIFGHVHGNKAYQDFTFQSFCASVERIGYAPIEFEQIKLKMGIDGD